MNLFITVRQYAHEDRTEYRGVVAIEGRCVELDVCAHQHRTETAARRCARRTMNKMVAARQSYLKNTAEERLPQVGKPPIDIL